MKDYYQILDISRDASEEEVRKAYRRLAFQHHPDRNPGDPGAEERFKEIAEAYGVLVDPVKRQQFDAWAASGAQERVAGDTFRYSQEEIFQDLFRDQGFTNIFQDLFKEFERSGLRSDKHYFNHVFFGGRGTVFGGVFFFGPSGPTRIHFPGTGETARVPGSTYHQTRHAGILERLGKKIGRFLFGGKKSLPQGDVGVYAGARDLAYQITLSREDAGAGTSVDIAIDRGDGRETLKVKVPPGTRSGTRLRLKGKGIGRGRESGDLYLTIHLA